MKKESLLQFIFFSCIVLFSLYMSISLRTLYSQLLEKHDMYLKYSNEEKMIKQSIAVLLQDNKQFEKIYSILNKSSLIEYTTNKNQIPLAWISKIIKDCSFLACDVIQNSDGKKIKVRLEGLYSDCVYFLKRCEENRCPYFIVSGELKSKKNCTVLQVYLKERRGEAVHG